MTEHPGEFPPPVDDQWSSVYVDAATALNTPSGLVRLPATVVMRLITALRQSEEALKAQVGRLEWAVESCVDAIENHLDVGNEDALVELLHDLRAHGYTPWPAVQSGSNKQAPQ